MTVLHCQTDVIEAGMKIRIPSHLSDSELIAGAKRLAGQEREATAQLVAHLAELDGRRIHLAAGFPSLFVYCREVLELSEQSTYNRIEAARAARNFPVILEMLSEAALTLATVRLLAPHLTPENHEDLLRSASHRSKREVEVLVARGFPLPAVPDSVRKVRAPALPSSATFAQGAVATSEEGAAQALSLVARAEAGTSEPWISTGSNTLEPLASMGTAPSASAARRPGVRPLAEDRYEIRFTAPASTCEKLKLAQDLLRHSVPSGEMAAVIDRALTALLEDVARNKFAATKGPRNGEAESGRHAPGEGASVSTSRHIAAAVRRTVWLRDGGRCAFVSAAGRRCGTRGFLEFHHVEPFAAGGSATSNNIQLRCRGHNAYEAQLYFDPGGLQDRTTCPGSS
jgi:hypothetical protein